MARPRSEEARRRVLAATAELVATRGVAQLTIEEVAARSGVAKTTIYRHWPERTTLILDAVNAHFEHTGTPDTGSLRGDLEAFYFGVAKADKHGYNTRVMPCLVEAATRDPEMGALLERIGEQRTRIVLSIVERAQQRGELPDIVDADVVVCSIIGPLVFQKLIRRRPVDEDFVKRCLDVAVRGLGGACSRLSRLVPAFWAQDRLIGVLKCTRVSGAPPCRPPALR